MQQPPKALVMARCFYAVGCRPKDLNWARAFKWRMVPQEARSPNFHEAPAVYSRSPQSEFPMEAVDTLISARWVIPIEPATSVLERHSIAIRQGRIIAVLPTEEAARRYSALEVLDRPTHALLPGFVNACADLGTPSGTGGADDSLAAPEVDPEQVRDTVALSMLRMLASGTTSFACASLFPQMVARTAADLHLRACIGMPVLERSTGWASSVDEYLEKAAALHDDYSEDPLISTAFATGETSHLTDATLQRLRRAADEIELPILVPLHEHENSQALSMERFGCRPLDRLEHLGLTTPQLVGLHGPHLSATDIDILSRSGMHVVACPRTSLRGGGDPCPVVGLDHRQVNVGLGTGDQPGFDLQGELQLASLLGDRNASLRPVLSPHHALRMATLGGAKALGLADTTGSLLPGKWADLCCIDLARLRTQPVRDVATRIVRLAGADQVTDVWVAGRALLASGSFVRLDPAATLARAARWLS
jgi:5-methylthioadenosine/S-adenosylhomocysteine deaminase